MGVFYSKQPIAPKFVIYENSIREDDPIMIMNIVFVNNEFHISTNNMKFFINLHNFDILYFIIMNNIEHYITCNNSKNRIYNISSNFLPTRKPFTKHDISNGSFLKHIEKYISAMIAIKLK